MNVGANLEARIGHQLVASLRNDRKWQDSTVRIICFGMAPSLGSDDDFCDFANVWIHYVAGTMLVDRWEGSSYGKESHPTYTDR